MMINEELKSVIEELLNVKNEKDLKILLLKCLENLINDKMTIEDYRALKTAFQTISIYLNK